MQKIAAMSDKETAKKLHDDGVELPDDPSELPTNEADAIANSMSEAIKKVRDEYDKKAKEVEE